MANHLTISERTVSDASSLALKGREIFIGWYTERAADWIPRRVQLLQDRVGIMPESIEIRDLGFRWGSCTEKGKIFFHWRLDPPATGTD